MLFYRTLIEQGVNEKNTIRFAFDNDKDNFYILLDEIQILDSFVGTLNDFLHHENFGVYVTGSNSQMLSGEVETKFRGRKFSIHILPLTFKEVKDELSLTSSEAW